MGITEKNTNLSEKTLHDRLIHKQMNGKWMKWKITWNVSGIEWKETFQWCHWNVWAAWKKDEGEYIVNDNVKEAVYDRKKCILRNNHFKHENDRKVCSQKANSFI